jgi:hypothetical protein
MVLAVVRYVSIIKTYFAFLTCDTTRKELTPQNLFELVLACELELADGGVGTDLDAGLSQSSGLLVDARVDDVSAEDLAEVVLQVVAMSEGDHVSDRIKSTQVAALVLYDDRVRDLWHSSVDGKGSILFEVAFKFSLSVACIAT